jgi:hypothetical protein
VQVAALQEPPALPRVDVPAVPAFDRSALIREVQIRLTRHKCYSGPINGNAANAQSGLEALDNTTVGKNSPEIQLTSANLDEFQQWLEWSDRYKQPICAPAPVAAPVPPPTYRPPPRREPVVIQRDPPRARQRPEPSRSPPPSRSPAPTSSSNPFTPTR